MMRTHKQGLMNKRRRWVLTLAWLLAILTISISAWAQGRSAEPPQDDRRGRPGRGGGRGGGPRDEPPPFSDPNFLAAEMRFGGKTVKGAPYTAEAVTEFTQTLGNGTRISRRSTTLHYRDSEGRTRQEGTLGPAGPFASGGEAPSLVFINDPVARTQYLLNPRDRTATKMSAPGGGRPPFSPSSGPSPGAPPPGRPESPDRHLSSGKQESLGKQMIEGVEAEGTRFTYTIPVGNIGNDRPIEVVSESWYSPVLQRVVLSKHSDPRFGESVSRLTNINQAEPARALFEVPADYKLTKNEPHREPNREWNERKK